MSDTVNAPTAKELRQGDIVTLARPGWENGGWSPHGLNYPIRFDRNAEAKVLASHFDEWVGEARARNHGITVVARTEKKKSKAKK